MIEETIAEVDAQGSFGVQARRRPIETVFTYQAYITEVSDACRWQKHCPLGLCLLCPERLGEAVAAVIHIVVVEMP
jgi:hypothetical protein